jgi:hypothetical protein
MKTSNLASETESKGLELLSNLRNIFFSQMLTYVWFWDQEHIPLRLLFLLFTCRLDSSYLILILSHKRLKLIDLVRPTT